jgi:hypothetical protein
MVYSGMITMLGNRLGRRRKFRGSEHVGAESSSLPQAEQFSCAEREVAIFLVFRARHDFSDAPSASSVKMLLRRSRAGEVFEIAHSLALGMAQ